MDAPFVFFGNLPLEKKLIYICQQKNLTQFYFYSISVGKFYNSPLKFFLWCFEIFFPWLWYLQLNIKHIKQENIDNVVLITVAYLNPSLMSDKSLSPTRRSISRLRCYSTSYLHFTHLQENCPRNFAEISG